MYDYSYKGEEFNSIESILLIPLSTMLLDPNEEAHYYDVLLKEEYQEQAVLNNDTSFEGNVDCAFNLPVSVNPITNLDIITNFNYNETYPAGSSISDLVSVEYSDIKTYLDNGYKFDVNSPNQQFHYDYYTFNRQESTLNEFNDQNQDLICLENLYLKLIEKPDETGHYSFTIQYSDNSGNILSMESELIGIVGNN